MNTIIRSSVILIIAFCVIWGGFGDSAHAEINVGDILVADTGVGVGTDDRGVIFIIDPSTGFRTVLTDFGNLVQGPLGSEPHDLAMLPDGDLLVLDSDSGTDGRGLLFHVESVFGIRSIVSDFGDPSQGPLGDLPQGVALFSNGDFYVVDRDAPNGSGGLFRVNTTTGDRTLVSDLSNGVQGPTTSNPFDVAEGPGGTIYLITELGGLNNDGGLLFTVDPVTGFRTIVSDLGDPLQGQVGFSRWLTIPGAGSTIYALLNSNVFSGVVRVNPANGFRTLITDFDNPAQGTTETNAQGIAVEVSGSILVNGGNSDSLFRIDPVSGNRTVLSDYADPAQGVLGGFGEGIIIATVETQVAGIPTLGEWGLIALAGILLMAGIVLLKRRHYGCRSYRNLSHLLLILSIIIAASACAQPSAETGRVYDPGQVSANCSRSMGLTGAAEMSLAAAFRQSNGQITEEFKEKAARDIAESENTQPSQDDPIFQQYISCLESSMAQ
jgi:exosortase sorting signal-containing protein